MPGQSRVLRGAQFARGLVLDQEGSAVVADADRLPGQSCAIQTLAAARDERCHLQALGIHARGVSLQILAEQCETSPAFAAGQIILEAGEIESLLGVHHLRIDRGQQFEIAAIGEDDQGVMCFAVAMLAAACHRETQPLKILYRGIKRLYGQDRVIESQPHL